MMGPYLESVRAHVGPQCLLVPGVRAIILNGQGEVLLQRRTDTGCWGLPAGSMELEDTALGALRREVREETGLEVLRAEPISLYAGPRERFKYPNGDEIQGFSLTFVVHEWAGEPKADGVEGSEVRFWPLHALPHDLAEIYARTLSDFKRRRGGFMLPNDFEYGKE